MTIFCTPGPLRTSPGQLGIPPQQREDGPSQSFTSRAKLVSPDGVDVKQVAAGFEHCLILDGTETLRHKSQSCRLGRTRAKNSLEDLPVDKKLFLPFSSEQGHLYGTGVNTDGQLGTNDDDDRHSFTRIPLPEQLEEDGIASLHAGADSSAVISKEGDLWTFGNSVSSLSFKLEEI